MFPAGKGGNWEFEATTWATGPSCWERGASAAIAWELGRGQKNVWEPKKVNMEKLEAKPPGLVPFEIPVLYPSSHPATYATLPRPATPPPAIPPMHPRPTRANKGERFGVTHHS